MIKLNYIHTMDFDFKYVDVKNCDTVEEFERKVGNGEVIIVIMPDKTIYGINSNYIIYWC